MGARLHRAWQARIKCLEFIPYIHVITGSVLCS